MGAVIQIFLVDAHADIEMHRPPFLIHPLVQVIYWSLKQAIQISSRDRYYIKVSADFFPPNVGEESLYESM